MDYSGGYPCAWCGKHHKESKRLRAHVVKHHPDVSAEQLERHIVMTRYPTLDLDLMVQRYKDRLETIQTIHIEKRLHIHKYLATIGILRSYNADCAILGFLRKHPEVQTAEELTKVMADSLVNKFRNASPEVRFEGYLNRDLSVLKKQGREDLIPAVKALKLIKFTKKQLEEARAKPVEETEEEPAPE